MTTQKGTLVRPEKTRLIERQRRLWAHAEAIEVAQKIGKPLPKDVSEWLVRALQNIACGTDANEAFNVIPEKQGVRKDSFLKEKQKQWANGYIAAATEKTKTTLNPKKTVDAISDISNALVDTKRSTVRANWNKASTDRKPHFTIGRK